jgi:hypothetical protein
MMFRGLRLPPGAEILCADGRGGTGNITLVFRGEDPPRVLKIYRIRRSRFREALGGFAHRFIEGKCGVSPAVRCETERLAIALWAREGFAVVPRLDLPPPAEVRAPCNWLAFVAAPTLQDVLADPAIPAAAKAEQVRRLAAECARRHRRALELNEPLLLHERGHVGHVFAEGDRLVFFDLENGFRAGYPPLRAIARELAGTARSILRADPAHAELLLAAFAAGYPDRDLLERAVREGQRGMPLARQRERAALLRRLLEANPQTSSQARARGSSPLQVP